LLPEMNNMIIRDSWEQLIYDNVYRDDVYRVKNIVKTFDLILDLGGHIGTFSRLCLDNGAKRVVSVECHPHSFPQLIKNCADYPNFTGLFKFATDSTLHREEIRDNKVLSKENFVVLEFIKNNLGLKILIKLDIEGWEYAILKELKDNNLLKDIDYLVGEYHPSMTPDIFVANNNTDARIFLSGLKENVHVEFEGETEVPYALGAFVIGGKK